ncbi:CPA_1a_G0006400.mRNA.1.CDS.1 [Saccharomyces cerevisiae]|nr:CPA_1a_G0006400.mRNA.1.CDS.1 [Saccharomyces cerevisiae]CAI7173134.1 CPA_1a_G0006400.mRNA.1.CDS.1 [Saccharomyces cerevisiae]
MRCFLKRFHSFRLTWYFFDGADCRAFFTGNFRNFLYLRTFMLSGLLNVGFWKYIQEAQLSSNDEPLQ